MKILLGVNWSDRPQLLKLLHVCKVLDFRLRRVSFNNLCIDAAAKTVGIFAVLSEDDVCKFNKSLGINI